MVHFGAEQKGSLGGESLSKTGQSGLKEKVLQGGRA